VTLAHVNKYYLETNLMAAAPSSHLDSLYADLQVHALDVSDGLAKVQTTLGTDMLTTMTAGHQEMTAGHMTAGHQEMTAGHMRAPDDSP
jgi:hypothetical protein